MKKTRKTITSVTLAISMAAMLGACSSGGSSTEGTASPAKTDVSQAESSPNSQPSSNQASAPQEEEAVTLRFASWQSNHDAGNQAVADAFHELHPNITVQFDYYGDMNSKDYLQKVDIMLMGQEPIDLVMAPNFADYAVRAESGSYLGLNQFFQEEGLTAEDEFNVVVPVNEDVYGIPGELKYNLVLINKDMLDAAGLSVPSLDWTWEDYRSYAKALTHGSGPDTVYGSYFHSWGSTNLYGISSAKEGNSYFNSDGTLAFDSDAFRDFLQMRYDMENVDLSSTPLADVKALNMNYRDQFFNGTIAMLPMGSFMFSDIGNEKYAHDFVTTFARMPLWDSQDPHYNTVSGNFFSVASTSQHPKEAYEFLKFWCQEGVSIKGMFISNEKGADKMESTSRIVSGFEDLIDMDALTVVMQDPDWVDSYEEFTPSYQSEIDSLLTEETDIYLLGSQSLDDTISNLMSRGNVIIEENK